METLAREDDEKLYGWESIASYLGCSAKTARKRERENALPVHSDGGGPERRRVFAYARELDAWQQRQGHSSFWISRADGSQKQQITAATNRVGQLNLSTPQDLTFSLAPDNAVLVHHRTAPDEIYMCELHYGFAW